MTTVATELQSTKMGIGANATGEQLTRIACGSSGCIYLY